MRAGAKALTRYWRDVSRDGRASRYSVRCSTG